MNDRKFPEGWLIVSSWPSLLPLRRHPHLLCFICNTCHCLTRIVLSLSTPCSGPEVTAARGCRTGWVPGTGGDESQAEEDIACGKALLSPCSAPDNGFSRASECPVIQLRSSPLPLMWDGEKQGPLDFPSERSFAGKEYLGLYQMGWNDAILSKLWVCVSSVWKN